MPCPIMHQDVDCTGCRQPVLTEGGQKSNPLKGFIPMRDTATSPFSGLGLEFEPRAAHKHDFTWYA